MIERRIPAAENWKTGYLRCTIAGTDERDIFFPRYIEG